jgi:hypothetical protein
MRTDGRTDMTKLIVAFRNFVKAPKTWTWEVHNEDPSTTMFFFATVKSKGTCDDLFSSSHTIRVI